MGVLEKTALDRQYQALLVLAPDDDDSLFERYVAYIAARVRVEVSERRAWEALNGKFLR